MGTLFFIISNMFFMNALAEPKMLALFQQKESLKGRICENTDIAFSEVSVLEKAICLIKCTIHVSCKSVFYVQQTGNCTGCIAKYDMLNSPTGLAEGSIYYIRTYCPDGWFSTDNSCYFIPDQKVNFQDGIQTCESLNAHVAFPNTLEENNNLISFINSITLTDEPLGFYIGFTDADAEGIWTVYDTSNQNIFINWASGEPNGGTMENCVALYVPSNMFTVDISCSSLLHVICETEK